MLLPPFSAWSTPTHCSERPFMTTLWLEGSPVPSPPSTWLQLYLWEYLSAQSLESRCPTDRWEQTCQSTLEAMSSPRTEFSAGETPPTRHESQSGAPYAQTVVGRAPRGAIWGGVPQKWPSISGVLGGPVRTLVWERRSLSFCLLG